MPLASLSSTCPSSLYVMTTPQPSSASGLTSDGKSIPSVFVPGGLPQASTRILSACSGERYRKFSGTSSVAMSPGSATRPRLYSSCDSKAAIAAASASSGEGSFSLLEDPAFGEPPGFLEADAGRGNTSMQRQIIRRALTFLYSLSGICSGSGRAAGVRPQARLARSDCARAQDIKSPPAVWQESGGACG